MPAFKTAYAPQSGANLDLIVNEGYQAFRVHGVAGGSRHGYSKGSAEHTAFLNGVTEAQGDAARKSQIESQAYHKLSVRDNAIDRKWAAKDGWQRQAAV